MVLTVVEGVTVRRTVQLDCNEEDRPTRGHLHHRRGRSRNLCRDRSRRTITEQAPTRSRAYRITSEDFEVVVDDQYGCGAVVVAGSSPASSPRTSSCLGPSHRTVMGSTTCSILIEGFPLNEVVIFNRWGTEVFKATGRQPGRCLGWNVRGCAVARRAAHRHPITTRSTWAMAPSDRGLCTWSDEERPAYPPIVAALDGAGWHWSCPAGPALQPVHVQHAGFNPAYAGSADVFTIMALSRHQWVGFEGAPSTQTLTFHSPLPGQSLGLGFSAMNDRVGPVRQTGAFVDFAYRIRTGADTRLAFGLKGEIFNLFQADLASLPTVLPTPPRPTSRARYSSELRFRPLLAFQPLLRRP